MILPLNDMASFILSVVHVIGCVPCIIDKSSLFPEVAYLMFPIPIEPGSLSSHSLVASVLIFGTRSKAL